jgi:hypothetical protein
VVSTPLPQRRMRSDAGHSRERFAELPLDTDQFLKLCNVQVLEIRDLHGDCLSLGLGGAVPRKAATCHGAAFAATTV